MRAGSKIASTPSGHTRVPTSAPHGSSRSAIQSAGSVFPILAEQRSSGLCRPKMIMTGMAKVEMSS